MTLRRGIYFLLLSFHHLFPLFLTLVSTNDDCWPRKPTTSADFNINPHVAVFKCIWTEITTNESRPPRNEEYRRHGVRIQEMKSKLLNRLATAGLVISIDLVDGKNNHREPLNCFSAEFLSTSPCMQRVIRSSNHNSKLNTMRQVRGKNVFSGGMLR